MWQRYSLLMSNTEPTINDSAQDEIVQYLAEPLQAPECQVGEYWRGKAMQYKRLSSLAKKYLSAPPATVFSERLFSTSGIICDRKRNRLDPQRVKMLVFLNKNLRPSSLKSA